MQYISVWIYERGQCQAGGINMQNMSTCSRRCRRASWGGRSRRAGCYIFELQRKGWQFLSCSAHSPVLSPLDVGDRRNALRFDYAKLLQVLRHVWSCWLNAYKCGLISNGSTHRQAGCACAYVCVRVRVRDCCRSQTNAIHLKTGATFACWCRQSLPAFGSVSVGCCVWEMHVENARQLALTAFVTANFYPVIWQYVCVWCVYMLG